MTQGKNLTCFIVCYYIYLMEMKADGFMLFFFLFFFLNVSHAFVCFPCNQKFNSIILFIAKIFTQSHWKVPG